MQVVDAPHRRSKFVPSFWISQLSRCMSFENHKQTTYARSAVRVIKKLLMMLASITSKSSLVPLFMRSDLVGFGDWVLCSHLVLFFHKTMLVTAKLPESSYQRRNGTRSYMLTHLIVSCHLGPRQGTGVPYGMAYCYRHVWYGDQWRQQTVIFTNL